MCVTTDRVYMKLVMVPINELKKAECNPRSRTVWNRKLMELKASIAEHGLITPLIIAKDGSILDGHRRRACIEALGWTAAPCVIRELGVQSGWVQASMHTQPITGGQLMYAVDHGLDTKNLPKHKQQEFDKLERWMDEPTRRFLAEREASPNIVRTAASICRYTGIDDDRRRKDVVNWLIRHKAQKTARWAMDNNISPALLSSRIENDEPLSVV